MSFQPTTVDDSKYNRRGPDADRLRLAGVNRILLSATPDGFGLMNVYFPQAVDYYLSNGIEVEAFHTWYPWVEPKDQVEAFRLALQYAGWFSPPVMLNGEPRRVEVDIERAGLPILKNSEATDNAWAVTTGISGLGLRVRVYTSRYMWREKVRVIRGRYPWSRFGLHVAHWKQWGAPILPEEWATWERWQYAGDVIFAGQDGIDLNIDKEGA